MHYHRNNQMETNIRHVQEETNHPPFFFRVSMFMFLHFASFHVCDYDCFISGSIPTGKSLLNYHLAI